MSDKDALLIRLADAVELLAAEVAGLLDDSANLVRGPQTASLRQRATALREAAAAIRPAAQSDGDTERPLGGQA